MAERNTTMSEAGYTPGNRGELILVVEDSPTQAAQLRYILEKHRYRVAVTGNAHEAMAVLSTQLPALVISDIVMPEVDGYELCRQIKMRDDCRNVPVILLTSLVDAQDVIRGLACGADNFLTKPYNEEYLLSRVSDMLVNRHHDQEAHTLPGLEFTFGSQKHLITSNRRQILDLLLSTYEAAICKNNELISARDELNELNERLQSANQDLMAFNSTVSHDLCQPLNNVITSCQAIEILNRDKLDEESKGLLKIAIEGVNRMADLIRTLLRFSHSSHSELQRVMVDLGRLAGDVAANLRLSEPERQVTIMIAEGVMANGDPVLLRVVLENLIGNAWKYTGKQTQALIEFGSTDIDGTTAYFVRDNGLGFSIQDAEEIFVPFKRLPGTTGVKGHGIGLATVERIIRRHGGRVWAEGQPGIGAVFYFTLNP